MAVKVRLKDGSNNVLHPETDWSVVLSRPSIKLRYSDGSHDTSSSSKLNSISKFIGKNSEAWDTYSNGSVGIVIGNRYNALGLYGQGTTGGMFTTTLQSDSDVLIAAEGSAGKKTSITLLGNNIKMASDDTNKNSVSLADYPIKWSAISNKPKYIPTDIRDITFGHYSTVTQEYDGPGSSGAIYPAIRIIDYSSNPGGEETYGYTCYYFNGTSWTKLTDNSKFWPGF